MLQRALGGQDLTLAPRKTDLNSPLAFRNLFSRSGEVFPLAARAEAPENRGAALLKSQKKQYQHLVPGR